MPYQIMYSSQATEPMTVTDLEKILTDARAGNQARGVTGAPVSYTHLTLPTICSV